MRIVTRAAETINSRPARPADQQRRAQRQLRPPGWQRRIGTMEECRIVKADPLTVRIPHLRVFPESFTKDQIDLEHVAHDQPLDGSSLGLWQIRNKADASVRRLLLKYRQRNGNDNRRRLVIKTRG